MMTTSTHPGRDGDEVILAERLLLGVVSRVLAWDNVNLVLSMIVVMMLMMVMMTMMLMMVMIERKQRWKRNFQWNLKLHDDDYGGKNDSETLLIWQFDCDDDVVDEVEEEEEDHNDLSITSCAKQIFHFPVPG